MTQTVAENLVSLMIEAGVKRIYGIVGDSANPLVDAVHRSDGAIRFIDVRNEEAGAFAAGAEANITGGVAAVFGSSGPGSLHLLNGLYDCDRNSASVFAVATHIPLAEIDTRYFQDTRPDWIFADCTKFLGVATTALQMPRLAELAMQAAILERGVGMVVLPGDVGREEIDNPLLAHPIATARPLTLPVPDDLNALADLINRSKKIAIYGGAGCRNAREEVLILSKKLQAPVAYAYRGKDILEADNPHGIGMIGLLGWGAATEALAECDLLLMLGTDFTFHQFFPDDTTIVQIDDNPAHLGRRAKVDMALTGDIGMTLQALFPLIERKTDSAFLDAMLAIHADMLRLQNAPLYEKRDNGPLSPELVAFIIGQMAEKNAIFTADTGMCVIWAARYLSMERDQRLLASYSHASMANALPQAIGAALAAPDRQVIALCGDGGLAMLMGELLTAVELELPVKLMVFNNFCRAMVHREMRDAGYEPWGTGVKNPDFGAVARAMGFFGERVEKAEDIRSAIARAFAHPGPALIDFVTDAAADPPPPKVMLEQLGNNHPSRTENDEMRGHVESIRQLHERIRK